MDNKLIDLLTEHCRKHYWFKDDDDIEIDTDSICFHLYHKWKRCFSIRIETVICKDFGFIKWLVDNDKIDYKKDWKNSNDTWYVYVKADTKKSDLEIKSDTLLMVLSIEDNPIEFLVSILK